MKSIIDELKQISKEAQDNFLKERPQQIAHIAVGHIQKHLKESPFCDDERYSVNLSNQDYYLADEVISLLKKEGFKNLEKYAYAGIMGICFDLSDIRRSRHEVLKEQKLNNDSIIISKEKGNGSNTILPIILAGASTMAMQAISKRKNVSKKINASD